MRLRRGTLTGIVTADTLTLTNSNSKCSSKCKLSKFSSKCMERGTRCRSMSVGVVTGACAGIGTSFMMLVRMARLTLTLLVVPLLVVLVRAHSPILLTGAQEGCVF